MQAGVATSMNGLVSDTQWESCTSRSQPLTSPPQQRKDDVAEQAPYFPRQSTQDQQNDTEHLTSELTAAGS